MNRSYYVTLLLQTIYFFCLVITISDELNFLIIIMGIALLLSFLGLIYQKEKNKYFAYIAMVGFIIYMPIGLFGLVSIRNEMDKESKLKFLKELENE